MPPLGPIKRRELIRYPRLLGFEGPYSGSKHQVMTRGRLRLRIPNPHQGDVSRSLLVVILREGGIAVEEWEKLE